MTKILIYAAWSVAMLGLYGWSAAFGYSPFGDGQRVSANGVFIGGYRSGPTHK